SQVTSAPCAPSETMVGFSWEFAARVNARPFTGQAGSAMPELFTYCAQQSMPVALGRKSFHVTIAPPEPSLAMLGGPCCAAAVQRAAPLAGHVGSTTPEARTCWAKMSGANMPLR